MLYGVLCYMESGPSTLGLRTHAHRRRENNLIARTDCGLGSLPSARKGGDDRYPTATMTTNTKPTTAMKA